MTAWYNEIDRHKAQTLRNLIEEGVIAPGVVDERSICEVQPNDLRGFAQCHFFAGGGVWSYALRVSGWDDDRPVWTGSCPCQPFSSAGKQEGFADARHLWPEWFRLIRERRPDRIFGEQVDDADAWIDLVSSDMEGDGYAFGAPDLPSAGFGGSHLRQRFYWVADRDNAEWWSERAPWHDGHWPKTGRVKSSGHLEGRGHVLRLGDPNRERCDGEPVRLFAGGSFQDRPETSGGGNGLRLAHADGDGRDQARCDASHSSQAHGGRPRNWLGDGSAVDWLYGRDGLWRPIEPSLSPLVDASPSRVRRLRLYGDAIDAEVAANFVAAYMECAP